MDLPALREFQERNAFEWLRRQRMGFAWQPGLGKTRATQYALSMLPEARRVLICAPKRVARMVWPAEAARWGHIPMEQMHILGADDFALTTKEPEKKPRGWSPGELVFEDVKVTRKHLRTLLENYRYIICPWQPWLYWLALALGDRPIFDTVVWDESAFVGNKTTRVWQSARHFVKWAHWRLALNGTPYTGNWESLFAQSYLLDQGKTFGYTLGDFRSEYLRPARYGPSGRVLEYGNPSDDQRRRLEEGFLKLWVPLKAADYLQMPALFINDVRVALPLKAYDAVSRVVRGLLASVEGKNILPASAGVGVNKAAQICNGWVYDDDKQTIEVHLEKLEALEELIGQTQGGILLFYQYNHEYAAIRECLGTSCAGIDEHGAVDAWHSGALRVLCSHPRRAAVGLNLQGGGFTQVWFGPTYDSFLWEQGVARTYRAGQQSERVVVHRIISNHPFEQRVIDVCEGKLSLLDALMSLKGEV